MSFCPECKNLLILDTSKGELTFRCSKCGQPYPAKPEQTLIAEGHIRTEESITKFNTFIANAAFDSINPRIEKPCPKCKEKIISFVRVSEDQKVFYTCKCGFSWSA